MNVNYNDKYNNDQTKRLTINECSNENANIWAKYTTLNVVVVITDIIYSLFQLCTHIIMIRVECKAD